jgi:predicted phosphohydrolase
VRQARVEAVLLGGDIGEAKDVVRFLAAMDDCWQLPLYFVLGNHDFYFGSIAGVRDEIRELARQRPRLTYLSEARPISLTPRLALVGHDGWADARLGDYERSLVMMNDYRLIAELARFDKQQRWPQLMALGDEAAAHIRRVLPAALERHEQALLLTHVPPLREACWHEGRISDDQWAPHFTCKAMGDAILEVMRDFPSRQLTVLCGHTHGAGETQPLENVHILTGAATYGYPEITNILEFAE